MGGSLLPAQGQTSFIPIAFKQVGLPVSHMVSTNSEAVQGWGGRLVTDERDGSPDSLLVFSDTTQWGKGSLTYPGEGFGLGFPFGLGG